MGLLGKLIGTALTIIETPIAIAKDAATLGSQLTDEGEPYTKRKLDELTDDYRNLKESLKKD